METAMPRRIGDVARVAGIGVETVRFYEREGLVDQPPKPMRGWREYDEAALGQINQIRLAQRMGLTLRDMKALKSRAKGPEPAFCRGVRETVAARLDAIDAEIAELKAKRAALATWLKQCRARRGDCPLYAQINALSPAKRKRK
jgi:MerR family mercuric resistance operon transcriptional regulator